MAGQRITAGEVKVGQRLLTPLGLFEVNEVRAGDEPGLVVLVNPQGHTFKASQYAPVEVIESYRQLSLNFKVE